MARLDVVTTPERTDVVVTLSRRNLLSLLHKLEMRGSRRTIANNDAYVDGVAAAGLLLVLQAEDDESHYGARIAPPGPVHPATQRFIDTRTPHARQPQKPPCSAGSDDEVADSSR
jgi:hypothetical protein